MSTYTNNTEPIYLVLMGAPGAGKGTQGRLLRRALGVGHIASGDLFREYLQEDTELSRQIRKYLDRGELVPDDLTISMVMDRLSQPDCEQGAILDGFPRTVIQAEALAERLAQEEHRLWAAISVHVSEEELLARLTGRWVCPKCKRTYHVQFSPPRQDGICNDDGTPLIQREDDTEETARKRLEVYFRQTRPMLNYYRRKGLLVEVNGMQPIEVVHTNLMAAVQAAEAI